MSYFLKYFSKEYVYGVKILNIGTSEVIGRIILEFHHTILCP